MNGRRIDATQFLGYSSFAATLVLATCAHAAMFTGLGTLLKPDHNEFILSVDPSISGDGHVVVGDSNRAFRWTLETGMEGLSFINVNDVSQDGSVAVGWNGLTDINAIRWTADSKKKLDNKVYIASRAFAVSADGSVVAANGTRHPLRDDVYQDSEVFLWYPNEDRLEQLGMPEFVEGPGPFFSDPRGVSADGNVVVGEFAGYAFRWTREEGFVDLGHLPGSNGNVATGVSDDGSIIVGVNRVNPNETGQPFRWTRETGMVALPGYDPQRFGGPGVIAISGDGSIIAGGYGGPGGSFIWDDLNGLRDFKEVLVSEYGLEAQLQGWGDLAVRDISSDGRRIVGNGSNPNGQIEAWIAILERSDLNNDGIVDIVDVNLLTTAIRNGSAERRYDLDSSGNIDDMDLSRLIHDEIGTWLGDANLDGLFNSNDLVAVFAAGQYEDNVAANSGWSEGDWNADGDFNSSDLVVALADGGYEQEPRPAVTAVPEPSPWPLILTATAGTWNRRGARRVRR